MADFTIKDNGGGKYILQVRDAKLKYSNFAGKEIKKNGQIMNREGDRNTCLILDNEEIYEFLAKDGFNIKTAKREDGSFYEPFEELPNGTVILPYIKIKVNYDAYRPPKVFLHTSRNRRGALLTENTIDQLDGVPLMEIKLMINPSDWEVNGKTGRTGYINLMHVTIDDDPFAEDYIDDIDDVEDEDIPFN